MSLSEAQSMLRSQNYRMAGVEATPEIAFVQVYNRLSRDGIRLERTIGQHLPNWRLYVDDQQYYLHRAKDGLRITHIGDTPDRRVYERYTADGAFAPDDGDTVVDVGGFIGELTWQIAAEHDVDITTVEPDPRNLECLDHNSPNDVRIEHCGAYYQNGTIEFNLATDGSESGILEPDKGKSTIREVPTRRLDNIVDDADFIKVEAEGMEPEVLLGMGALRPARVVVNVSPERNGHSPAATCRSILEDRGYTCQRDGDELFAAQQSSALP